MKKLLLPLVASSLMATGLAAIPASAQSNNDQREARKEMKAGNVLSLREIESRILPTMNGSEYLGPAYDSRAVAWRLKFIRSGQVMFVDVDARTGRVIKRSH